MNSRLEQYKAKKKELKLLLKDLVEEKKWKDMNLPAGYREILKRERDLLRKEK